MDDVGRQLVDGHSWLGSRGGLPLPIKVRRVDFGRISSCCTLVLTEIKHGTTNIRWRSLSPVRGTSKKKRETEKGRGSRGSIVKVVRFCALRYSPLSPVRGTSKKNQKRKRAEGVEGPSPGGVWGGNRRVFEGSKGPYLMGRMNLKAGLNRPVQSQAVTWATAGLLADLRRCLRALPAARRRQQPQAT